jgi:membrane protease YdiL (CAAX protease family)
VTRWVAFLALTIVVIATLLALARLSQRALTASPADPPAEDQPAGEAGEPAEPTAQAESRREPTAPATGFSTGALLANVALTQGLFGAVLAGGALGFGVPGAALGLTETTLQAGLASAGTGVAAGLLLWLGNEGASRLADATGSGYDETLRELLAPDSMPGWVILLGGVLPVIALVEEFIFRAALIGAFAAGLGVSPWLFVPVSAAVFGAAHGAQGKLGIAVTGGLGLALAAGFVLTESLLVVVLAHYLVNALEFVVHEGLGRDRDADHV